MARKSFCRNLVVVLLSPRTSVESRSLVVRFLSLRCGSHVCYSELRGMPVVVAILETYPAVAPQRSACCCEPLGLLYKRTASAEQFLLLRAILTLRFFSNVVGGVVVSSRSNISSSSTYEGIRLPNETPVTSFRFVICRSPPPLPHHPL